MTCWTEINACLTGYNCNNLFSIVPEYSQDEIRSPDSFILFLAMVYLPHYLWHPAPLRNKHYFPNVRSRDLQAWLFLLRHMLYNNFSSFFNL